jgi:galactokinase
MVYAFLLETFYQTHNMHWFKVRIKYGILKRTLTGKKNITAASNYNKKKINKTSTNLQTLNEQWKEVCDYQTTHIIFIEKKPYAINWSNKHQSNMSNDNNIQLAKIN